MERLYQMTSKNKYTQREWDRTVGYGKVPDKYNIEITSDDKDGINSKTSDTSGETFKVPSEEILYKLNDPIWDKRWTDEQIVEVLV